MIEVTIDFDEIRERVIDYIFAATGVVANTAESVIDAAEQAFFDATE